MNGAVIDRLKDKVLTYVDYLRLDDERRHLRGNSLVKYRW